MAFRFQMRWMEFTWKGEVLAYKFCSKYSWDGQKGKKTEKRGRIFKIEEWIGLLFWNAPPHLNFSQTSEFQIAWVSFSNGNSALGCHFSLLNIVMSPEKALWGPKAKAPKGTANPRISALCSLSFEGRKRVNHPDQGGERATGGWGVVVPTVCPIQGCPSAWGASMQRRCHALKKAFLLLTWRTPKGPLGVESDCLGVDSLIEDSQPPGKAGRCPPIKHF